MKILYVSHKPIIYEEQKKILGKYGEMATYNANKISESKAIKVLQGVNVLVIAPSGIPKISEKVLKSLPDLKFITTVTTGYDWIDIEAARRLGIKVSICKGANAQSVAEQAWGLIIDLSKRITEFDRDVRNEGAYDFKNYRGKEVYKKTLGVLGLGDIGSRVAKIALAFEMDVLGFNRSKKNIEGVKQVELTKLLKESDIISVNLPLTSQTDGLIGKKELSLMKDGVILVNTAREEIVHKKEILKALKKRKVFGYGVETQIMKPIKSNDPYLKFKNVIAIPHNAFNTEEANKRVKDTWVENVVGFIKGKPINVAN